MSASRRRFLKWSAALAGAVGLDSFAQRPNCSTHCSTMQRSRSTRSLKPNCRRAQAFDRCRPNCTKAVLNGDCSSRSYSMRRATRPYPNTARQIAPGARPIIERFHFSTYKPHTSGHEFARWCWRKSIGSPRRTRAARKVHRERQCRDNRCRSRDRDCMGESSIP